MPAPALAQILRASALRYGGFRARGVPAILLGASAIVLAAGTVRVMSTAAPKLAETIREATKLAEVLRGDQRRLPS